MAGIWFIKKIYCFILFCLVVVLDKLHAFYIKKTTYVFIGIYFINERIVFYFIGLIERIFFNKNWQYHYFCTKFSVKINYKNTIDDFAI